jgi:predicted small secreted protein
MLYGFASAVARDHGALDGNRYAPVAVTKHWRPARQVARDHVESKLKKLLVVLALSSGLLVSACNTLHGAANDVKSVGDCADGKPGNC